MTDPQRPPEAEGYLTAAELQQANDEYSAAVALDDATIAALICGFHATADRSTRDAILSEIDRIARIPISEGVALGALCVNESGELVWDRAYFTATHYRPRFPPCPLQARKGVGLSCSTFQGDIRTLLTFFFPLPWRTQ